MREVSGIATDLAKQLAVTTNGGDGGGRERRS
jgi:hypothetical protein